MCGVEDKRTGAPLMGLQRFDRNAGNRRHCLHVLAPYADGPTMHLLCEFHRLFGSSKRLKSAGAWLLACQSNTRFRALSRAISLRTTWQRKRADLSMSLLISLSTACCARSLFVPPASITSRAISAYLDMTAASLTERRGGVSNISRSKNGVPL